MYAVVLRSFVQKTDGPKLILLTHDKYRSFEDDIVEILKRENLRLVTWTDLQVERTE